MRGVVIPFVLTLKSIVCDHWPCVRNLTFCLESLADDVQNPEYMKIENVE